MATRAGSRAGPAAGGSAMAAVWWGVILVFLAGVMIHGAVLFDLFVPGVTFWALAAQLAAIAVAFILPGARVAGAPRLLGLVVVLFLGAECLMFGVVAHDTPNYNAAISFAALLGFVPVARARLPLPTVLGLLLTLGAIYVAVYLLTASLVGAGAIAPSAAGRSGHEEGVVRLILFSGAAAFVAFAGVSETSLPAPLRLVLIGLGGAAILVSDSRTFTALFALVLALHGLRGLNGGVRLALFLLAVTLFGAVLAGLALPNWNPFSQLVWDQSGLTRAREYNYALEAVRAHWVFGIGIPASTDALGAFLRSPKYEPVWPSDLGAMGPLLLWGLPGLLLFLAATWFVIVPPAPSAEPLVPALKLTGILCGLFGVLSPSLLLEQNALFLSCLVAAAMRARARNGAGA